MHMGQREHFVWAPFRHEQSLCSIPPRQRCWWRMNRPHPLTGLFGRAGAGQGLGLSESPPHRPLTAMGAFCTAAVDELIIAAAPRAQSVHKPPSRPSTAVDGRRGPGIVLDERRSWPSAGKKGRCTKLSTAPFQRPTFGTLPRLPGALQGMKPAVSRDLGGERRAGGY